MTKFNWDDFPVIPDFDCLKWKAERQAEILRETEGMTDEEIRARFRRASERAALRRKVLAERQAAENQQ
jgi:hypothetical protein